MNTSVDKIFIEGDRLSNVGEFAAAFAMFKKGAEGGDLSCMTRLAVMYFDGEGTEKSIEKSIEWDLKAVDLGDSTALHNLAITYREMGENSKAEKWFKESISHGNGGSALELAKLYISQNTNSSEVPDLLNTTISSKDVCETDKEEASNIMFNL